MNLNEKLVGVVRVVAASISPFKGSGESKQVFLEIDYSGCTVNDILGFASADRRIAWANGGSGRKAYDKLSAGSHIKIVAEAAGVKAVDPDEAKRQLAKEVEGKSDEEATAYLLAELKRLREKK